MTRQIALALLLGLIEPISGVAQTRAVEPSTSESFTLSARWSLYLHRTFGPSRAGLLAAEIAVDQFLREPHCWDTSAGSYAQRYARAFDRRLIRNTAEFAAGMVTGEDLRYKSSHSHSTQGRIWHALESSVMAQMPDGRKRPAYTRFFASTVAEMSTTHWTGQRIHTGWAFQSVGWSALDQAETNLLDEFGPDIRRIAGRLWKRAERRRK
jgi:hypothetical protein